jgi:hypothetical protein
LEFVHCSAVGMRRARAGAGNLHGHTNLVEHLIA